MFDLVLVNFRSVVFVSCMDSMALGSEWLGIPICSLVLGFE